MITIGIFLVEIIGTYVYYYWLAIIPLAITLIFAGFGTTLKRTPRWLIKRGKIQEAGMVLLWLRGNNYDVVEEQRAIEDQIQLEKKLTFSQTIRELKSRPVYYPLTLALLLMAFQQFSGINAIIFNAEDIFKSVHGNHGLISSLAVGLTQVLATFVGVLIADVLGR